MEKVVNICWGELCDKKNNYGSSTHHLFSWMGSGVCLALLSCIFLKPDARAAGLWLYEGSIPDMGMANAGRAASALDASTAGGNPAGMTVLDRSQLVTGVQSQLRVLLLPREKGPLWPPRGLPHAGRCPCRFH